MTQKEKELLLKDLSARLPYKCKYRASKEITHWHKLTLTTGTIDKIIDDYYDEIKPYLRPMSNMTEEEYKELKLISPYYGFAPYKYIDDWCPNYEMIDWLNKNHFDYRRLIEKGLAIEVTEENNPYKE